MKIEKVSPVIKCGSSLVSSFTCDCGVIITTSHSSDLTSNQKAQVECVQCERPYDLIWTIHKLFIETTKGVKNV